MQGYLFDTSALSQYMSSSHQFHATAKKAIDALPIASARFVCTITLAEMRFGLMYAKTKTSKKLDEMQRCVDALDQYTMLDITKYTASAYAELKTIIATKTLKKSNGKRPPYLEDWCLSATDKLLQVGENDLWICAIAKERDLVLVTGDGDFDRMKSADASLKLISTRQP